MIINSEYVARAYRAGLKAGLEKAGKRLLLCGKDCCEFHAQDILASARLLDDSLPLDIVFEEQA